ncbi:MAG: class I SAM-dependent methyltransferase [Akkermansiaceae bacterium]
MIKEEVISGSLLLLAHEIVAEVLQVGDTAVDATLGNGHDALFLAGCVGSSGMVFGFDIQEAALRSTAERLEAAGVNRCCYQLMCESHAEMERYVTKNAKVAIFNLGYLPGGDKTKITLPASTLAALSAAVNLLSCGGILTVMCYPGHEGGADEVCMVDKFIDGLASDQWSVTRYKRIAATNASPYLWVARKGLTRSSRAEP